MTPEHGGRIGNPPHEPSLATRQQVLLYSKIASQETIATALGISVDTLQRHYREELDQGQAEAILTVGGKLLEKCLKGDGPSIRFYLATRGKGAYSRRIEVADVTDPTDGDAKEATEALIEMLVNMATEKKRRIMPEIALLPETVDEDEEE